MRITAMMLWSLAFLTLCFGAQAEIRLSYDVVQKLGNSCPQLDSCAHQRASGSRELFSIKEKRCACDNLCHEYGDCCIDAPGIRVKEMLSGHRCYELKQFGGIYMIDRCLDYYYGPDDVRYQCESTAIDDLSDPFGAMPITDSVTGITYKNYYCSLCNYKTENLVLWTPRLECPTVTLFDNSKNVSQEYVFRNITFSEHSWGLFLDGENGSLFFHDCEVDPVMPMHLESKIRLCKPDLISTCAYDWEDDDVRRMCMSYMGIRFIHGGDRYRNAHCAVCNGVNTTHLSCKSPEWREMTFFRQFEAHAFSLLLDINEGKGPEVGKTLCRTGELYDPFFKMCRSLHCLPGYTLHEKECKHISFVDGSYPTDGTFSEESGDGPLFGENAELIEFNSKDVHIHSRVKYLSFSDSKGNETLDSKNITGAPLNLSNMNPNNLLQEKINKLLNCLLISLTAEDYTLMPDNATIYVPKYNKTYEPTSYHAADGSVLVCSHFTQESYAKFKPEMGYITVSFISVSMFCLILHIVVFCIVPDLRNLSGKNLASYSIALFVAYLMFLIGSNDDMEQSTCYVLSFLTCYFFLASFHWMGVMAFDVWRTLKLATTQLRVAKGKQLRRFLVYSLIAWINPLLIIAVAASAEFTDLFPTTYRPTFASPQCWFKQRRALLVFFGLPLIIIIILNFIFFVTSWRMLVQATQTKLKQQNQSHNRSYKLYLRLAILMGLTWILGFAGSLSESIYVWYLFVFFNTLQGLSIFIGFSCTSKVYNYFKDKRSKPEFKSNVHSNSTGTTTLTPNITKKFSSKFLLRNKRNEFLNSSSGNSVRKDSPSS